VQRRDAACRVSGSEKKQVLAKDSYQGIALAMPEVQDQMPLQGLRVDISAMRTCKPRFYRELFFRGEKLWQYWLIRELD